MLFAYEDPPAVMVSFALADGPTRATEATRAVTATRALAERRIYSPWFDVKLLTMFSKWQPG
jgi:hypothetical protein